MKEEKKITPEDVVEMMKEGAAFITGRTIDEFRVKQFVYGSGTLILSTCPKCRKGAPVEKDGLFICEECGSKFRLIEVLEDGEKAQEG